MTYQIRGLDPERFRPLFGLDGEALKDAGALRMEVSSQPGFPCRITLIDRAPGETVLLLNHLSHDVANPYRASQAIFVGEQATAAADHVDEVPAALAARVLSLRAFDAAGMMADARLAQPGEVDAGIRLLFDNPQVAYIHAHNAVRGCFAAKVERCP